jgi:hypothetical protein
MVQCEEPWLDSCVEQGIKTSFSNGLHFLARASQLGHACGALLGFVTPGEFEVMELAITGMLNKQIGAESSEQPRKPSRFTAAGSGKKLGRLSSGTAPPGPTRRRAQNPM